MFSIYYSHCQALSPYLKKNFFSFIAWFLEYFSDVNIIMAIDHSSLPNSAGEFKDQENKPKLRSQFIN